jgi:tetratricopeptide (TPR) repeat protein
MLGEFDQAGQLADEAGSRLRDLAGDGAVDAWLGQIAATANRHGEAVTFLRRYCDAAETQGHRSYLATFAPMLGRSLCALGRHAEAEPLAQLGRTLADERDSTTQALWRQVQALVEADRGNHDDAEALARKAITATDGTDFLNGQGDALCDLAELLVASGRTHDAAETFVRALERYEQKNNRAGADYVRARITGLTEVGPR